MEVPYTATEVEYIPEWRGNRKDANPIRVTLRFLNTAQRTQLMPWRPDGAGGARLEPDIRGLVLAGVAKVENLVNVAADGQRKEIRTGFDLMSGYGFDALVMELATEIGNMSQAGIEKNS